MAAIMCELCGSNDVVKQGEYFVCQHCGTKYTVEDAKKLIGTVKIDNSDFVQKYLQNARRAKEKEDWDETEKYYNMVEQNDPDNIEAIFYSAYGKARSSLTSNDVYKRQAIFNALQKSISILDDHYKVDKEAELKPILMQISTDIILLGCSNFVYTQRTDEYGGTSDNSQTTFSLFAQTSLEFINTIDEIVAKFPESQKGKLGYMYQMVIDQYNYIANCGVKNYDVKRRAAQQIGEAHKFWNRYDPSHVVPNPQEAVNRVNAAQEEERKKNASTTWQVIAALAGFAILVLTLVNM
ncbi:MAG: hypothetical protein Q4E45_01520 [Eubacteriales bacterium]|nr:hypothetical protein [Eubacteriales bacterium]